jgi:hypothetical protein
LTFAVGIVTGVFLSIPTWWRRLKDNRSQKKRIHELEREVLDSVEQENKMDIQENE